ncbi:unnamed protein product, partial [Allacma fusca]
PVHGNLTLRVTVRPIGISIPTGYQSYDEPFIEEFHQRFNGYHEFRFSMYDLKQRFSQLENVQVLVEAKVGEAYWEEYVEGYSKARIYNSTIRLRFLGGSPQVFKPAMPFTAYLAISYHDGSPLSAFRLINSDLEILPEINSRGGRRTLSARKVRQVSDAPGIWKVTFDLKQELSAGPGLDRRGQMAQMINDITELRVQAVFSNQYREIASTELMAVSHYSPRNRNIRVTSSTSSPKVRFFKL